MRFGNSIFHPSNGLETDASHSSLKMCLFEMICTCQPCHADHQQNMDMGKRHMRTHGAAKHSHQVEERIKSLVVVLNKAQHNSCQPLALKSMSERKD